MFGTSLHARSPVYWRPLIDAPPPTPAPAPFSTLVLEGDSITSDDPSTPNGSYAYQYDASRPDKAIEVRADGSRVVSVNFVLNDGGNSLISHVAADTGTYGAQLITAMIGANDMAAARTAAQYKADLAGLWSAYKAAGAKFAWSAPIAYNPDGSHASHANFTVQRAAVLATCRDPEVWSGWCDYYIPMGEHPDFADAVLGPPLFSDGVHPNAAGQAKLYEAFKPALDTLLDAGRAASTQMYAAAWPTGQTGLPTSTAVRKRFVVSGLAHTGIALTGANALAVTGGGAQLRRGGGAWAGGLTGWLYNGDVIDLEVTSANSASTPVDVTLQVGSETRVLTFATGAAVDPVAFTYVDHVAVAGAGASHTLSAVDFPAAGRYLLFLHSSGPRPSTVSVGGADAGAPKTFCTTPYGGSSLSAYLVEAASAGAKSIQVAYGGYVAQTVIGYGRVENADAVLEAASPSPGGELPASQQNEGDPHATGALTVPAGGLMVAALSYNDGATSTTAGSTASGTTFVADERFLDGNGALDGLVIGTRGTGTGAAAFGYKFGAFPRIAVVLKAAG